MTRVKLPAGSLGGAVRFCGDLKFRIVLRACGRGTGRGMTFLRVRGCYVRSFRGKRTIVTSKTCRRITLSIESVRRVCGGVYRGKCRIVASKVRRLPF